MWREIYHGKHHKITLSGTQISEKICWNIGKTSSDPEIGPPFSDPEIRPPFQENYVETSTSDEQVDDTHINLMGLNDEHQVFLSQEDHKDDDIKQFQTKSGESFDFKQGYDTAVYEVHKQYKLRSRTVNITQPEKQRTDCSLRVP